ncbi:uncharacterized protein LOC120491999 isoform X2 [Pimephales promelas]|uniref:uncharacterized protein LOC120491999 isoform X2 n=1 Tax=Pimephales promelas TaxID=90988 RepID=UPI0019556373|nr:uncharacterized protein LOC120491999 isoform X2 [Pimephales promelas]
MLSVWTLLAAAICAVPVSAISQRDLIHGRQLLLDLPERTASLDFTSADERDKFTIWEHRGLSLSKPSKGQVNNASNGWSFIIRHVTFDDEGTYTLRNHFGATISSYTVKVNTNREIIERVAGEKLSIPLLGLRQSDATLRFYGNYSSVILVENGVPVGKEKPDYINRLKVTSEMIQILNVNVSDLGRYQLTDNKGRTVSNYTMLLVDQHPHNPGVGFLALMLLGIPCGICFCCRKRICNRCRTNKSQTVESNNLNTVPVSIPCSNTVIDPVGPIGPGGPGQGFQPAYVPQNPVYPPDFGVPPAQNYTPGIYSAPPGPEAAGFKMNEPSPNAPLLTPQPESH